MSDSESISSLFLDGLNEENRSQSKLSDLPTGPTEPNTSNVSIVDGLAHCRLPTILFFVFDDGVLCDYSVRAGVCKIA